MKISRIVDLHVDAGWRVFSFLKIETDAGTHRLARVQRELRLQRADRRHHEAHRGVDWPGPSPRRAYARTRQAPGGPCPAVARGDRERAR